MPESANLDEARDAVARIAAKLGLSSSYLPTFGRSEDFGWPHVEADQRGYHYIVVERGLELSRQTTRALHELLFWVARDVTSSMAVDFEVAHRQPGRDLRRLLFAHQLELLRSLDSEWAERRKVEVERILLEHPYSDEPHPARCPWDTDLHSRTHLSWRVAARVLAVAAGMLISATTCRTAGRTIFVLGNEDPASAPFALLLPIIMPVPLLLGVFAPRLAGGLLCAMALGSAAALLEWVGFQTDKAAFQWNYVYVAVVLVGVALYWSGRGRRNPGAA